MSGMEVPMSYQPKLSSSFNDTKMRSSIQSASGMCSFCAASCAGPCEIALSAVLGSRAVYPTNTGDNQVASEKDYPIDFSHFNINGRVFGAIGAEANGDQAAIFNVKLSQSYGSSHPVKLALPVILPALIKLDWEDYFSGAAMAGVSCVIGEGAYEKDPQAKFENGIIKSFPLLPKILDSFNAYYRGYGQIILQCNTDDDVAGLPELAIREYGVKALEFKFGQSAKGTQPACFVPTLEEALASQRLGVLVHPDPSDPKVAECYEKGWVSGFYTYGRLPMWTESYLVRRIGELKEMGLENVTFKMAGYDPQDLEQVLRIACAAGVDLVTFDGAGGGSGYSPCKMMNEWGLPAVCITQLLTDLCKKLEAEGMVIPALAVTGGFVSEDQIYKALALGAPYVKAVGLCRSSMAAAMTAKNIGEQIRQGKIPAQLRKFGSSYEEIFRELADLRGLYERPSEDFAPGAVGVYSYLSRIAFGLQHFAALNRKFHIGLADQSDLIPLTRDARDLLSGTWFDYLK